MKKILVSILLMALFVTVYGQFDSLFYNQTLRIDYENTGNRDTSIFALKDVKKEPFWGGPQTHLTDTFGYGNYFFKVFDSVSGALIYSHGYSTLFSEWRVTGEAERETRSFAESVIMPLPRNAARIEFYRRSKGHFVPFYTYHYSPSNYFIGEDQFKKYPVFEALSSGDPARKVDIVLIPEGYTEEEMGQFLDDCMFFTKEFFTYEPYTSLKDKFNIHAVLAPSAETGVDIPKSSLFRNTLLDISFYTFGTERYLMTSDFYKVRDVAANAPYDQIYIIVNTKKYGGGAIYNYYNTCINGDLKASQVFIHEFGHGFAGLGDEYGYGDDLRDLYPKDEEPWEPNLTSLVHFEKKWKSMVEKDTPIPTPATSEYRDKTGAFEGAGYVKKGIYRPQQECLMRSFKGKRFCSVCQDAIRKMILFYAGE